MAIQQGRHGYLSIAGTVIPAFNVDVSNPRNLVAPVPLGNTFQTNAAEGLRSTRVAASFLVRESAAEILAQAFWDRFLVRTWASGFDDTAAFAMVASDGRRLHTLANVKAESFTLSVAKGQPIGLQAVFVAPGLPTIASVTPANYANTLQASPPLMADRASFAGISGNLYGFELTWANNHVPDARLDGTKVLTAWDAGPMACTCRLTVDAKASGTYPVADGDTVSMTLTGAATRVFTMKSLVVENPDNAPITLGQQFRSLACLVMGTNVAGTVTPPLVVT